MISSRCPRPIGTSESMALSPVCTGSCTERRGTMPGALTSTRARVDVGQRALAVDRLAERIDDAAEQAAADRHIDDGAGALDGVALADAAVVAEHDDADIVGLEIERHALHRRSGTRPSRRPGPCRGRRRGRCRRRSTAPGRPRRHPPRCRNWRSAASGSPKSPPREFPSDLAFLVSRHGLRLRHPTRCVPAAQ